MKYLHGLGFFTIRGRVLAVSLFEVAAIGRSLFPRFAVSGFGKVLAVPAAADRVAAFLSVFETTVGWLLADVDFVASGLGALETLEFVFGRGLSKYFSGFLRSAGC